MLKKIVLAITFLMFINTACLGAAGDFQGINSNNAEMRKNLAWLTEGLYQLGNSKNKKLMLTKAQKKKILPIFQELIDKNLIILKFDKNNGPNDNGYFRIQQNQGGRQIQGGQRGSFNANDPEMQKRIKQMQELTDFGNAQMDLIDGILTKEQVRFIDNMKFDAGKYGFIEYQRIFSANNSLGQRQWQSNGQGQTGAARQMNNQNQAAFQQMRQKVRAAQEELVKLNNEVMKILKS